MNATPETQAVVLLRALQQDYPKSTQGRKRNANMVVVRGATAKDRGRITTIAHHYTHGFTLDIRYMDGYYTIRINEKDPEAKAPSWREVKEATHPLPEMREG